MQYANTAQDYIHKIINTTQDGIIIFCHGVSLHGIMFLVGYCYYVCLYMHMLLLLMSAPGKIPDNYAVMAIKYCIILYDGKANRCFRAGYEA